MQFLYLTNFSALLLFPLLCLKITSLLVCDLREWVQRCEEKRLFCLRGKRGLIYWLHLMGHYSQTECRTNRLRLFVRRCISSLIIM